MKTILIILALSLASCATTKEQAQVQQPKEATNIPGYIATWYNDMQLPLSIEFAESVGVKPGHQIKTYAEFIELAKGEAEHYLLKKGYYN